MVKLLVLEYHENVMEKDANDYTYLHMAAISGHANILMFFLSRQVSLHSKNNKGETALQLAEQYEHTHIIEFLKNKFEA